MVWKNKDSEERGVREGLEATAKPQPRREGRGPKLAPIAAKKERNQRSPALAAASRPGQALRPEGFLFYFFFVGVSVPAWRRRSPMAPRGSLKAGPGAAAGTSRGHPRLLPAQLSRDFCVTFRRI